MADHQPGPDRTRTVTESQHLSPTGLAMVCRPSARKAYAKPVLTFDHESLGLHPSGDC